MSKTTGELLLEWDRRRPRSKQTEIGMSELGGCRRRAGYRLRGDAPTNEGGSVQAVMGTAVHAAVEQVFHEMQAAGLLPADDLVEFEVRFAGVLGHLDRYDSVECLIIDTKTTSQKWLDHIRLYGAEQQHKWQTALYAAAVQRAGHPVKGIEIHYVARDTGEEYVAHLDFEVRHVREALEWLDSVRGVEPERLNRDYAPDTAFCQHCPFFTQCWDGAVPDRDPRSVILVEDADAAEAARALWEAREDQRAAKARAEHWVGVLDGLRPNDTYPSRSAPVVVDGFEHALSWSLFETKRLDTDQVERDYLAAGGKPPRKASPTKKLMFVPIPDPEEPGQ